MKCEYFLKIEVNKFSVKFVEIRFFELEHMVYFALWSNTKVPKYDSRCCYILRDDGYTFPKLKFCGWRKKGMPDFFRIKEPCVPFQIGPQSQAEGNFFFFVWLAASIV